jgi:hypothetical protein
MSKTRLVALLVISIARTAAAQPIATPAPAPAPAPEPEPVSSAAVSTTASSIAVAPPLSSHAFVSTLGFTTGNAEVGSTQGGTTGVVGSFGYRIGAVTARALVDYYSVGQSGAMPVHGRATRFGAAARYAFAHTPLDSDAALDFWGELGAGYEHVAWHDGGVLDRPSYEGAFGFDLGARGDRRPDGHRRFGGAYVAFRTLVAQAPAEAGAMPTCAGPCSQATLPPRTDVTLFFDFGAEWGR